MFSHNGKISEKQMRRMLVVPVFASVIFVLPYLSAQIFGKSVLPGVLVFFAFAILYVTCIYGLGKWQEKAAGGNISYLENAGGTGKCLAVIQLIRLLLRLTFYILLAVAILGEAQVPFMQGREADRLANLFVVLPLLLVALYGASRDVEKQGRIHEMVFWVMFIPFIIMILFGLYEVDYGVFKPRLTMSFGKIMLYGYALLTFILPVENYLYLSPDLRRRKVLVQKETDADGRVKGSHFYQKKQNLWISYLAVLFVVLLAVILTLFILGIYGVNGAGGEEMVTIAIMRYIRLPFGVLERFDVLMVWFFMTGCFILICDTLYYMGYLFEILFENVRKIWFQVLALAIALLLAAGLPDYTHSLMLFLFYGALLDIPLSLLVPLLGIIFKKKTVSGGKKMLFITIPILCSLLLTGCGNDMKNVEQRDYATILLISDGESGDTYQFSLGIAREKKVGEKSQVEEVCSIRADNLEELAKEYQAVKGKDLSLAHLKVILISMEQMQVLEEMQELLYALDENEEIAKTCPVLLLSDSKGFLKYLEKAEEPVGTYISNLVQTKEKQGKEIPWLKDYLKVIREGNEMLAYALEPAPEGWQIRCRTKFSTGNGAGQGANLISHE